MLQDASDGMPPCSARFPADRCGGMPMLTLGQDVQHGVGRDLQVLRACDQAWHGEMTAWRRRCRGASPQASQRASSAGGLSNRGTLKNVVPAALLMTPCSSPARKPALKSTPRHSCLRRLPLLQVLSMASQPKSRYYKTFEACKAVPIPRYYEDQAATVASYVYGAFAE